MEVDNINESIKTYYLHQRTKENLKIKINHLQNYKKYLIHMIDNENDLYKKSLYIKKLNEIIDLIKEDKDIIYLLEEEIQKISNKIDNFI